MLIVSVPSDDLYRLSYATARITQALEGMPAVVTVRHLDDESRVPAKGDEQPRQP